MPEEMRQVFAASGTIHVFAISGLHIALVTSILIFFVRMAGLPRLRWGCAVVPLLVIYMLVTGARPSAVRACLMASCVLMALPLGRKPNVLAALLGTLLALHFWQPSLLFNAGSVLSFSIVAGLVVLVPHFSEALRKALGCAPLQTDARLLWAAGSAAQATRAEWSAAARRYAADALAVSLAAWLVSIPLTGYYFGRVALGGLLANLIVVPCAFLVVTAGFIGMLAGLLSPWVAVCFNHAAGFFTMAMVRTAEATASVKALALETGTWSGWAVALWFAAIAAYAAWARKRKPDGLEWLGGVAPQI